jgi:PTH1 family peptidyl-tRNA hydrolase
MQNLYLIVGLGNPGADYSRTRHNAGFLLVERLASLWGVSWAYEKRFNARLARAERAGVDVLLGQPQTYMNSSGEAVGAVARFYRVPINRLLVVVDDADLPLGEIRLRSGGSSGGHHGLESVEQQFATREYARLRIGIGRERGAREITNYVLGRFSSTETPLVDTVLTVASRQVECWLGSGIQKAMSQFNGSVVGPEQEGKDQ